MNYYANHEHRCVWMLIEPRDWLIFKGDGIAVDKITEAQFNALLADGFADMTDYALKR